MHSQPCYSVRLMKPFARLLRTYPNVPEEVVAPLDALDIDGRVPIATVHELLRGALVLTGDEAIGLKAAALFEVGDFGALEYAASTAQTSGEALATIGRYMRLINDALTFSISVDGELAVANLENAVVLPPAAEDFEVAAFHAAIRARVGALMRPFEVCFTHAAPADDRAYREAFTELATVRFAQPFTGFRFSRAVLSDRLPTADPRLHALVRGLADRLIADLPRSESFTARVRERLMEGLARGDVQARHVADALHVSTSTLTRRLDHEGTSFKELLEGIRRSMALRYVGETDLALSEIAFLLGFSQTAAFHRAFKRWTDQTPLEHRARRRG
jgi:AraC-like DNA-binding protein